MPKRTSLSGSELFIVDNSDQDWKVLKYLHDWCQISKAIDIATGFFEIGSLMVGISKESRADLTPFHKRNSNRFPSDFMFQLNEEETEFFRSHFATSKTARGGRRYLPFVFTEQGVAMLSSVLNSERAIEVNILKRVFGKEKRRQSNPA